uniref:Uncharacterized protein n=1 Tax=Pseudo-nitzschia australis TaxID=44445 RepID=A0A7S4ER17_9STRA|mmetsp:Transcript_4917/g.10877  ORF Transcript_4917/g.10877 Transcript_4917/m.10877 type:complete len:331 (-) Transcript_4917:1025-2017(-)
MTSISLDRNGSQRRCVKDLFYILLILLVALVSGQEEYSQPDLEAMTEAELEDICIKRGFQLVNDEAVELTKQDYIEAAQRCLAIEQEMNELLTQYPELADELEEEIKKMEKENAEKQAMVDELENQTSNDTTRASPEPGMAFHREKTQEDNKNDDGMGSEVDNDELFISEEVPVDEPVDNSMTGEEEEATLPDTAANDTEQLPTSMMEFDPAHIEDEDLVETETDDTTTNAGTEIESPDNSTMKEDLTMTTLAIESLRVLLKNTKDDVKRIIALAIPVLQPILNAGDAAWRQVQSLFLRAREAYEAYQATNQSPSEGSEVAETCDDSIPA